jgi:hypothetical protein
MPYAPFLPHISTQICSCCVNEQKIRQNVRIVIGRKCGQLTWRNAISVIASVVELILSRSSAHQFLKEYELTPSRLHFLVALVLPRKGCGLNWN